MRASLVARERDADRVWRSGAAVLEGKHQATAAADEIRRRVRPRVEIGAAAQRLPELSAGTLAHVVDDCDRDRVLALQLPK
jgi:hypothetical protein